MGAQLGARARGYREQVEALGSNATTLVNVINALAEGRVKFVPEILVTGGGNGSGAFDGLAATAMKFLSSGSMSPAKPEGGSQVPPPGELPPKGGAAKQPPAKP